MVWVDYDSGFGGRNGFRPQLFRIAQCPVAESHRPAVPSEHVQLDSPALFRMAPSRIKRRRLRALQAVRYAGYHLFASHRDGPRPGVGAAPYDR